MPKKNKQYSSMKQYKLNAICPYYTMFPLEFPMNLLNRKSKENLVLDVFCGRGTTNYAAQVKGMESYGIDSSPVAVAIAKAKLSQAKSENVLALLDEILNDTDPTDIPEGEFWGRAYHSDTLEQICKVRETLLQIPESDETVTLRAIMLGCLHGPRNKIRNNPSYFSNQMPRTFSSKPDYSIRYWKRNRMRPRKIDIRGPVSKKAKNALSKIWGAPTSTNNIVAADSRNYDLRQLIEGYVNIVITSPPYYGMRTYVQDQWLRNWFLGGPSEIDYTDGNTMDHTSPYEFSKSLASVWDNIYNVASEDIKMVIRFGGIGSRSVDPRSILMDSLKFSAGSWRVYYKREVGTSDKGRRQALVMGESANSKPIVETDYYIHLK